MNEERFRLLINKRGLVGLTRREADELGRLLAEREGREYGNADLPPPEVLAERRQAPVRELTSHG
jgi:hypothetical protein